MLVLILAPGLATEMLLSLSPEAAWTLAELFIKSLGGAPQP